MEFLFSCSTRHLTRSLSSLVSYRVKHSKRNSISTSAHVLYSIYPPALRRHEREIGFHWLELYALVKIFSILKWKCESLIGWYNHTTIIWPQNNGNAMTHFLGKVPVVLRRRFPVFLKMSHNDISRQGKTRKSCGVLFPGLIQCWFLLLVPNIWYYERWPKVHTWSIE